MKIEVTFPKSVHPDTIKRIIEGNMKKNSHHECTVDYVGFEDGENVFSITAKNPHAFYCIGITAAQIMDNLEYL